MMRIGVLLLHAACFQATLFLFLLNFASFSVQSFCSIHSEHASKSTQKSLEQLEKPCLFVLDTEHALAAVVLWIKFDRWSTSASSSGSFAQSGHELCYQNQVMSCDNRTTGSFAISFVVYRKRNPERKYRLKYSSQSGQSRHDEHEEHLHRDAIEDIL